MGHEEFEIRIGTGRVEEGSNRGFGGYPASSQDQPTTISQESRHVTCGTITSQANNLGWKEGHISEQICTLCNNICMNRPGLAQELASALVTAFRVENFMYKLLACL
ncbi:hypothetical protein BTVI_41899 [Pitangus sulphuratus]|nr:hypothetical protein BTVI_41899 [Pitangus sulphuratus]